MRLQLSHLQAAQTMDAYSVTAPNQLMWSHIISGQGFQRDNAVGSQPAIGQSLEDILVRSPYSRDQPELGVLEGEAVYIVSINTCS